MSFWLNSKHKEYYGEDGGYIKERLEAALNKHIEKTPLDHPDGAVTTEKIRDKNVTEPKLADGSVSERAIAANAVTSGKIKDKSVTDEKIGERTVTINKKSVTAQVTSLMQSLSNEIERAKSDSTDMPEEFSKLKEQIGNIEDLKAGDNMPNFEKSLVSAINSLVYGQSIEAEQLDDYNENWEPSAPNYDSLAGDGRYFINHYREGYGGEPDSLYYVGTEILSVARFEINYEGDKYTDAILAVMLQCSVYKNSYKFRFGIDDHEKMIWNDWTELVMSDQVADLTSKLDTHKMAAVLDHPNGSVTTAKIADGAISEGKIAGGAVTHVKLAENSVWEKNLGSQAVTNDKIANGAITFNKIQDGAVTTAKMADGAISEGKISGGAVTHVKLADNSVWHNNIGHNAVEEYNIADGSVTNAKLADNAVGLRNIDAEVLQKCGAAASAVLAHPCYPMNEEWLDTDTGRWELQFSLPQITIKDTVFGEISLPKQEITYSGQAEEGTQKFYIYAKYELENPIQDPDDKPLVRFSGDTPQILKKESGTPINYIEVNGNEATAVYVFLVYVTTEGYPPGPDYERTPYKGSYNWNTDTEITFLHS